MTAYLTYFDKWQLLLHYLFAYIMTVYFTFFDKWQLLLHYLFVQWQLRYFTFLVKWQLLLHFASNGSFFRIRCLMTAYFAFGLIWELHSVSNDNSFCIFTSGLTPCRPLAALTNCRSTSTQKFSIIRYVRPGTDAMILKIFLQKSLATTHAEWQGNQLNRLQIVVRFSTFGTKYCCFKSNLRKINNKKMIGIVKN
jgi:hypothetical protein